MFSVCSLPGVGLIMTGRLEQLGFRDYQRTGTIFMVDRKRAILGDEMGLGKTLQALGALETGGAVKSILILCPKVAVYVWQSEIIKWLPYLESFVHIHLGPTRHKEIETLTLPHVLITTYDLIRRDEYLPLNYDLIITDEAHRYRNYKTKTFKAIKKLRSPRLYQLTGTPAARGPENLWTMLHLINPKLFSSYWKFVNTWCETEMTEWGKVIVGPRNVEQLKVLLRKYLIRRLKSEVLEELPEKTRQYLHVEMTASQNKWYAQLAEEMIAEIGEDLVISPTSLTTLLRLRQMLIHPQLIAPSASTNSSAAITAVLEHAADLPEQHFAIFCPFAKALPLIREALIAEGYYDGSIIDLKGGMNPEEVGEAISIFEATRGIALCTIKFAQSFSLSTASYGYFMGYEFNPDENYQAEDRLHRMTSKNAVTIYYVLHKDTVEEHIMEILHGKASSVKAILAEAHLYREAMANIVNLT